MVTNTEIRQRAIILALCLCACLTAPAPAQERTVIDYRAAGFSFAPLNIPEAERSQVIDAIERAQPAYFDILGPAYIFLGKAEGRFIGPGANETAYLIAPREPVLAGAPAGSRILPHLAIFDAKGALLHIAPPSPNFPHRRLVGAADADGDGWDELLLEGGAMNMGTMEFWVNPVSFTPGRSPDLQRLSVYEDTCDNTMVAEPKIVASAITILNGAFSVETSELPCLGI